MILGIIVVVIVVIGGSIGMVWTFYNLFNRAKKRYWDLYQQTVQVQQEVKQVQQEVKQVQQEVKQVQQEVKQVQQEVKQVQQEVKQVQQHLLLEHLSDMSIQARDANYITSEMQKNIIQLIHEMEMDNLQGKTLKT